MTKVGFLVKTLQLSYQQFFFCNWLKKPKKKLHKLKKINFLYFFHQNFDLHTSLVSP